MAATMDRTKFAVLHSIVRRLRPTQSIPWFAPRPTKKTNDGPPPSPPWQHVCWCGVFRLDGCLPQPCCCCCCCCCLYPHHWSCCRPMGPVLNLRGTNAMFHPILFCNVCFLSPKYRSPPIHGTNHPRYNPNIPPTCICMIFCFHSHDWIQ